MPVPFLNMARPSPLWLSWRNGMRCLCRICCPDTPRRPARTGDVYRRSGWHFRCSCESILGRLDCRDWSPLTHEDYTYPWLFLMLVPAHWFLATICYLHSNSIRFERVQTPSGSPSIEDTEEMGWARRMVCRRVFRWIDSGMTGKENHTRWKKI